VVFFFFGNPLATYESKGLFFFGQHSFFLRFPFFFFSRTVASLLDEPILESSPYDPPFFACFFNISDVAVGALLCSALFPSYTSPFLHVCWISLFRIENHSPPSAALLAPSLPSPHFSRGVTTIYMVFPGRLFFPPPRRAFLKKPFQNAAPPPPLLTPLLDYVVFPRVVVEIFLK